MPYAKIDNKIIKKPSETIETKIKNHVISIIQNQYLINIQQWDDIFHLTRSNFNGLELNQLSDTLWNNIKIFLKTEYQYSDIELQELIEELIDWILQFINSIINAIKNNSPMTKIEFEKVKTELKERFTNPDKIWFLNDYNFMEDNTTLRDDLRKNILHNITTSYDDYTKIDNDKIRSWLRRNIDSFIPILLKNKQDIDKVLIPIKKENNDFVYVIQMENMVKIGKSINPQERLKTLQTGSPLSLNLLFYSKEFTENELQEKFKKYRQLGEWYIFADEIKEFIKYSS